MMDENKKNHPADCRCWMCEGCGSCCQGRRHWAWLIVKILVILIVFWFGVKVGELKSFIGYSWGYPGGYSNMRSMMWGGNYGANAYGPGMMGWYWNATSTEK
ncbi:MAG: hypothetical protein UY23_C0001G0352 [Candidatus Jorgensenbacteria bacterium GW2011_GWA1_48_11]|uniref:Uncharacterized protein n=1 Tax=Candidatus Jorgensenbacteria bacterium GW2011_GWA1_48_11 TaxID=1618660 RepID=A0A0G1UC68_9BACT|nr:MAG: hypothetical protein UY23_C0001G0352 [Candidatus Jorgensenbacteria bacterium GW2011_GWA1_48_11]KKW12237.1 MAG: hypothetical protein UY51_C0005G0479 [Candidatus Jorgensenbacteria bacterium GW2011_GWB1_49_9]